MNANPSRAPKLLNTDAVTQAVQESGMDAIVVMSPKNVSYLSGHPRLTGSQRPGAPAPAIVIATRTGTIALVVNRWHAGLARNVSWITEFVTYRNYAESAFLAVANFMEEHDFATGMIGLEMDYIVDDDYRVMSGTLTDATFCDIGSVIDEVRIHKSEEYRRESLDAYERLSAAVLKGLKRARPDGNRLELHTSIMREVLFSGSDSVCGGIAALSEPIVPLVTTRAEPLADDRALALDYTCAFGPYAARLRRVLLIEHSDRPSSEAGPTTEDMRRNYASVRSGVLSGMKKIVPGMTGGDAAGLLSASLASAGHPPIHSVLGHGVALGYEDRPVIAANSDDVLDRNVEFVLEPRVASGLAVSLLVTIDDDGVEASDTGFNTDKPYTIAF